jgi:hypothetical protein
MNQPVTEIVKMLNRGHAEQVHRGLNTCGSEHVGRSLEVGALPQDPVYCDLLEAVRGLREIGSERKDRRSPVFPPSSSKSLRRGASPTDEFYPRRASDPMTDAR